MTGVPWKMSRKSVNGARMQALECPLGFPKALEHDIGWILVDII